MRGILTSRFPIEYSNFKSVLSLAPLGSNRSSHLIHGRARYISGNVHSTVRRNFNYAVLPGRRGTTILAAVAGHVILALRWSSVGIQNKFSRIILFSVLFPLRGLHVQKDGLLGRAARGIARGGAIYSLKDPVPAIVTLDVRNVSALYSLRSFRSILIFASRFPTLTRSFKCR